MRGLARGTVTYVCTSCLYAPNRHAATKVKGRRLKLAPVCNNPIQSTKFSAWAAVAESPSEPQIPITRVLSKKSKKDLRDTKSNYAPSRRPLVRRFASTSTLPHQQDATQEVVELSEDQLHRIEAIHKLRQRLTVGLNTLPKEARQQTDGDGISLDHVLTMLPLGETPEDEQMVEVLKKGFGDQPIGKVRDVLAKVTNHRRPAQRKVSDKETVSALASLGVLSTVPEPVPVPAPAAKDQMFANPRRKRSLMQSLTAVQEARKSGFTRKSPSKVSDSSPEPSRRVPFESLNPQSLDLSPLQVDEEGYVPQLSFDLSRVLFNPGIYQLQDPRSRVFNFDPYLAQPMPLSEFNFQALNEYVTSSKDERLLGLARDRGKRYIGSSSSMSAALCQFHFLISQWREINTVNLTRGFSEEKTEFTMIQRCPAAIFLRWKNGVYAVDADKEYDEPNVLMSLGKSLEKLLTLERADFEKWRKTGTAADQAFADLHPEAYHYSTQGKFLLRSQLDAKDPRLPGSGVFDLKTRAVAGIRMNIRNHELGRGYQIKDRYGNWESFEREYYDMMRAAFLKYSLQVRMGNMDGIFVAYHNIERLFGFQYIPISELDLILHGQSDRCLGDQEFRMSIDLMNQIFDKVTAEYPEQSIRFHFETRDATKEEPRPFMRVFAEPMTDQMVDEIQAKQDSEFATYEEKLSKPSVVTTPLTSGEATETLSPNSSPPISTEASPKQPLQSSESSDANPEVLDKLFQQVPANLKAPEPRPLIAFKIQIANKINNVPMIRPEQITEATKWTMDYRIERINDDVARKEFNYSRNRRISALRGGMRDNHSFLNNIRELSKSGALWRQEQDEKDAQRQQVVLYET